MTHKAEANTHKAEAKTHKAEAKTHKAEARFFGLKVEARPQGLTSLVGAEMPSKTSFKLSNFITIQFQLSTHLIDNSSRAAIGRIIEYLRQPPEFFDVYVGHPRDYTILPSHVQRDDRNFRLDHSLDERQTQSYNWFNRTVWNVLKLYLSSQSERNLYTFFIRTSSTSIPILYRPVSRLMADWYRTTSKR